jgi:hypothetical protein
MKGRKQWCQPQSHAFESNPNGSSNAAATLSPALNRSDTQDIEGDVLLRHELVSFDVETDFCYFEFPGGCFLGNIYNRIGGLKRDSCLHSDQSVLSFLPCDPSPFIYTPLSRLPHEEAPSYTRKRRAARDGWPAVHTCIPYLASAKYVRMLGIRVVPPHHLMTKFKI